MTLRFGRTLPPAAAPIPLKDTLYALTGCLKRKERTILSKMKSGKHTDQNIAGSYPQGKAALVLVLKALHFLYPDRNEVVIPAFTCFSVPAAVKAAGLKVKLCDMGAETLDFDRQQLQQIFELNRQEGSILAVLVTHLFGCPSDIKSTRDIVGDELPIIEDAAQAMGEELAGRKLGTIGDIGFFSLGRGKALSTIEGGIIVTNREDLADELNRMIGDLQEQSFFEKLKLYIKAVVITTLQRPSFFWLPKMLPFLKLGETLYPGTIVIKRFSPVQRRLARNWRDRLEGHRNVRNRYVSIWREHIPGNRPLCVKKEVTGLIRYPLLISSGMVRDQICQVGQRMGLGVMRVYPTAISDIPEIKNDFVGVTFFNAQNLADCLVTLPVHEYVKPEESKNYLELAKQMKTITNNRRLLVNAMGPDYTAGFISLHL